MTVPTQAAYRAAILQLHPDKAAAAPRATSGTSLVDANSIVGHRNSSEFAGGADTVIDDGLNHLVAVQTAWQVLGDPQCREAYDRHLSAESAQSNVR